MSSSRGRWGISVVIERGRGMVTCRAGSGRWQGWRSEVRRAGGERGVDVMWCVRTGYVV